MLLTHPLTPQELHLVARDIAKKLYHQHKIGYSDLQALCVTWHTLPHEVQQQFEQEASRINTLAFPLAD